MLLTVNRLGSTNISLRRLTRGLRRRRRSAGGCTGAAIAPNASTRQTGPPCRKSRQLFDACATAHRHVEGVSRFHVGRAGDAFATAGVDVEAQVPVEVVPPERRVR